MPTPTEQLRSRTIYTTDGITTFWDFSFTGGYLDSAHVKAYIEALDGSRIDVAGINLVGPYQIKITPALASGNTLVIYRDTPKDLPIVDFTDGSGFSELSLDTNAKQAVFIAAETLDTLDSTPDAAAAASAVAAANSALAAAGSAQAAELSAASINTANLVNTSTNQIVNGTKTFSSPIQGSVTGAAGTAGTPFAQTLLATTTAAQARSTMGISAASGSADVGYTPAGTGAVASTVQAKLRESVSVFDFMTDAQIADVRANTASLDVTAAVQAAINAAASIYVPTGTYLVNGLTVNKNNFAMIGESPSKTIFKASSSASITISVATTNSVTDLYFSNFKVLGNSTALGGIKVGQSDALYCARPIFENVAIFGYSKATAAYGFGVWLCCVQNASFNNCWVYENYHGYQRLIGDGYATSTKIYGKAGYVGRGTVGIYIAARYEDLHINDVVIESNAKEGIALLASAVTSVSTTIHVKDCYFEGNNGGGNGVISIRGGAGYLNHIATISNCHFSVNNGYYIDLDQSLATIANNRLTPVNVRTTSTTKADFLNNFYPNGANYLAEYRALLGTVTAKDFRIYGSSTDLQSINIVDVVTFPVVERPVDDPNTLDDYREGTWTPTLSSDGTAPTVTAYEDRLGRYTKIGRMVHVYARMRATLTAIGTGTPSVTGLPFAVTDLQPCVVGLSNLLNVTTGANYGVGTSMIFSGKAWVVSANGYLVFSCSYMV